MSRLSALAAILLLSLAGCIGAVDDEGLTPSSRNASTNGDGTAVTDQLDEDAFGEFCEAEDACDFWDDQLHEYVLYNVDTPVLDVLIVPSAAPNALESTAALRGAVDAWDEGVDALGETWFADGFQINAYTLGEDVPPPEAIEDPEIIVLAAEFNPALLFGIGLEPKQFTCQAFGQSTIMEYEVHAHHGMEVRASDCTGIGFTCFAINTNMLGRGLISMQDLVAHEVGHCLGAGHVGDALDFRAKTVALQDIMSYQHDEEQVHCVSNHNVRVLERLYAPHIEGAPTDLELVSAGDFLPMDPTEYRHVLCDNPAGA